jgi:hypothetical protein
MAELLQNLSSSLGMYFDNVMGLNLALSLSIFIGGNFIVKNKGLKKAGYIRVRIGMYLPNALESDHPSS